MLQVVLVIVGVLLGVCVVTAVIVRFFYAFTVYGSEEQVQVVGVKCKHCTGGKQVLVDTGDELLWGPIPEHWRIDQKDGYGWGTFEPPVANSRNCTHCLGLGHTWMSADDFRLPPPLNKRNWF